MLRRKCVQIHVRLCALLCKDGHKACKVINLRHGLCRVVYLWWQEDWTGCCTKFRQVNILLLFTTHVRIVRENFMCLLPLCLHGVPLRVGAVPLSHHVLLHIFRCCAKIPFAAEVNVNIVRGCCSLTSTQQSFSSIVLCWRMLPVLSFVPLKAYDVSWIVVPLHSEVHTGLTTTMFSFIINTSTASSMALVHEKHVPGALEKLYRE